MSVGGECEVNVLLSANVAIMVGESGENFRRLLREFERKCANM